MWFSKGHMITQRMPKGIQRSHAERGYWLNDHAFELQFAIIRGIVWWWTNGIYLVMDQKVGASLQKRRCYATIQRGREVFLSTKKVNLECFFFCYRMNSSQVNDTLVLEEEELNCPLFTEHDDHVVNLFSFWLEGVSLCTVALGGLFGNFISVYILSRQVHFVKIKSVCK